VTKGKETIKLAEKNGITVTTSFAIVHIPTASLLCTAIHVALLVTRIVVQAARAEYVDGTCQYIYTSSL